MVLFFSLGLGLDSPLLFPVVLLVCLRPLVVFLDLTDCTDVFSYLDIPIEGSLVSAFSTLALVACMLTHCVHLYLIRSYQTLQRLPPFTVWTVCSSVPFSMCA